MFSLSGDPARSGVSIGMADSGTLSQRTKPAPLTRAERVRRYGVDCGDCLQWAAGWEPGGEYVKLLTVKNVSNKVMKLTFKLPESKFFSMSFPEPISLMGGLSHTLRVHQQPLATCRRLGCEPAAGFCREAHAPPPQAPSLSRNTWRHTRARPNRVRERIAARLGRNTHLLPRAGCVPPDPAGGVRRLHRVHEREGLFRGTRRPATLATATTLPASTIRIPSCLQPACLLRSSVATAVRTAR